MPEKAYFLIERRVRKQKLLDFIRKNPNITESKLKGLFSLATGLSFRKIEEYLTELVDSELVSYTESGSLKIVE